MENKNLLKVLLTILTIVLIVVVPIWVGPGMIDGKKIHMLFEWVIGFLELLLTAVVIFLLSGVFYAIYEIWDDII